MKIYRVGGAVRDELLGLPVTDHDHVVVGATPEEMARAGFRPVGRDFPVFLHPETHEEYALARTERKSGRGYRGFQIHTAPDVTLEQDLARRDLTINAMARDESGAIIDPHGGAADLRAGVLRHVSAAFAEDPVRILRVARFAARFGFAVAPETMQLMRTMVADGEADALVAERVWQEFARGLMERSPQRMFEVLGACGALDRVLPEWPGLDANHALAALAIAAGRALTLPQRFAALLAVATSPQVEAICARLRSPGECRDLALLAAQSGSDIGRAASLDPAGKVDLLQLTDALRRPERFEELIEACACNAAAAGLGDYPRHAQAIRQALAAAQSVDAGAVAQAHPADIPAAVRAARIAAIAAAAQAGG